MKRMDCTAVTDSWDTQLQCISLMALRIMHQVCVDLSASLQRSVVRYVDLHRSRVPLRAERSNVRMQTAHIMEKCSLMLAVLAQHVRR